MKMDLAAHPPFYLPTIVRSHGWVQLDPFDWDDDSGRLTRIERLDSGRVVEVRVQAADGGVCVEADDSLNEAERDEVACKVEWMLGLRQDFSTFYALAREEPKLARIEEQARGRILRSPTLFEDTVKTILTTNTSWGGTIRMVKALVSQFGAPLNSGLLPANPTRHAFPTPGQLAATDVETLRSETRLGYRSPYVLELARSVDLGALDLESLKADSIPTAELRKRLLAIKGVGEYAMANLLMLLGRYDFIPVDSWARTVVSHEWYGGEPVGRAEIETAFEQWEKWKGLAYWFWEWSHASDG